MSIHKIINKNDKIDISSHRNFNFTFKDFGNCKFSICLSLVRLLMIVARQRSCIDMNSLFITPNDISVFAAVLHIIGYRGSVTSLRPVNAIPRLQKNDEMRQSRKTIR